MKLPMAKDSLFAILLRSPWWISFAVAAAVTLGARLLLPEQYVLAGTLAGIPFVVTGAIASWRQLRGPGKSRIAATLEAVGAMSWRDFSGAIEDAFRRDGYAVTRLAGQATDFELVKDGRTSLVSCKRWKAANTGIEPLRELHDAQRAREAHEGIYIAVGSVTDNARQFATGNRIRIMQGPELAALLPRPTATGKVARRSA
jgi:restriction system protein